MTLEEKHRRMEDVRAAETNLREVIARSCPRGSKRIKAIDNARYAGSLARKAIYEFRGDVGGGAKSNVGERKWPAIKRAGVVMGSEEGRSAEIDWRGNRVA